ncbi:uncharacterized protein GF1gp20 [Trichonephila inaurata madagascariensis]|uniref:Uncharacterized protein GF1gp20 n=1 Tax=Trichonephila inaurata madagascariensis TaxID=2747483 RepID=A0A8X6Y6B7_9ARAC|nr:uncharacterized protein GF1gp20 [Trichonephila inaurata madagascariensis]
MALTKYKYKQEHSVSHAIAEGYKQADDYWGIPGAAGGFGEYAKNNKLKTTVVVGGTFLAVALTAAYFLSPAYAAFVGTVGTKAATLVSPAITAVSAFLVAHPLVASLIVVAAVAALIAAPVYAYKNSSKASQIDGVKEEILKACEKEGDKPKVDGGKLKINGDASTLLTNIAKVVELVPKEAERTA